MKIKRILCPVDFSASSDRALEYAAFLARTHRAKLLVLHVLEHLQRYEHFLILALTPQEIAKKMEEEAKTRLEASINGLKADGKIETTIREGKAFVEIIKMAREQDIDLIVLGSHGHSALEYILIGSVAEKVARKAPCPVLIVRDKEKKFTLP